MFSTWKYTSKSDFWYKRPRFHRYLYQFLRALSLRTEYYWAPKNIPRIVCAASVFRASSCAWHRTRLPLSPEPGANLSTVTSSFIIAPTICQRKTFHRHDDCIIRWKHTPVIRLCNIVCKLFRLADRLKEHFGWIARLIDRWLSPARQITPDRNELLVLVLPCVFPPNILSGSVTLFAGTGGVFVLFLIFFFFIFFFLIFLVNLISNLMLLLFTYTHTHTDAPNKLTNTPSDSTKTATKTTKYFAHFLARREISVACVIFHRSHIGGTGKAKAALYTAGAHIKTE